MIAAAASLPSCTAITVDAAVRSNTSPPAKPGQAGFKITVHGMYPLLRARLSRTANAGFSVTAFTI
jgi:hypothetical protein